MTFSVSPFLAGRSSVCVHLVSGVPEAKGWVSAGLQSLLVGGLLQGVTS